MRPACRRAHDDSAATAKVLLMVSLAAAASGQMLTAVVLLMTSELSRQTSLWFETFCQVRQVTPRARRLHRLLACTGLLLTMFACSAATRCLDRACTLFALSLRDAVRARYPLTTVILLAQIQIQISVYLYLCAVEFCVM